MVLGVGGWHVDCMYCGVKGAVFGLGIWLSVDFGLAVLVVFSGHSMR